MGLLKIFQQNLHICHRNDSTSLCTIHFIYILVLEDVIGSDVGGQFLLAHLLVEGWPWYRYTLNWMSSSCELIWSVNTGLIQLRNELAHYVRLSSEKSTSYDNEDRHWSFGRLPRPINNERTCTGCPQILACAIYQRFVVFPAYVTVNVSLCVARLVFYMKILLARQP